MKTVTLDNNQEFNNPHGCTSCYQVNKGYIEVANELLVCKECGGTVLLGLQSAFDFIAYLKMTYGDNNNES